MKKAYIKPQTVEIVMVGTQRALLAGSSPTGSGGTTIGGGIEGDRNKENGGNGTGGDGEFSGSIGAKDFNAWINWDE